MQKWEYIMEVITAYGEKKLERINEIAKDGWELAFIQENAFYFRRPLETEAEAEVKATDEEG